MVTLMKVGSNEAGLIYLNHENRKIEKLILNRPSTMKNNFPGIADENFNYLKLEKIMKFYMGLGDSNKNLEFITEKIREEGFFFGLAPSLKIQIEILE